MSSRGAGEGEDPTAGDMLARRYRLVEQLGAGGNGQVWLAVDTATGHQVAAKLLSAEATQDRGAARREVATLRLLRLPGVVRLLDEGVWRDRTFLVMQLVLGRPFPGDPAAGETGFWRTTRTLLDTLAEVHAAGVVHRDLKPPNILVSASGLPTLLDFGICLPSGLLRERAAGDALLGTASYMAPEQIRGGPISPATDLYALGVILFEVLAGRRPHGAVSPNMVLVERVRAPAPSLRTVAPLVSPRVAEVVDALLARRPEDRPGSASEVLARLYPRSSGGTSGRPAGAAPRSAQDLRDRFGGRERLFHLRSDAACILWQRVQQDPARVDEELASWVRAGIAHEEAGSVHVPRESLVMLEAGIELSAGRLVGLLGTSAATDVEIGRESLVTARRLADEGRHALAVSVMREGVTALCHASLGPREGEAGVLLRELWLLWLDVVIADRTPGAADVLLHELSKYEGCGPDLDLVHTLAQASIEVNADPPRALDALDAMGPLADPRMVRGLSTLRMVAARSTSVAREEATLASVAQLAEASEDPELRARLEGYRGRVAYRKGSFREAAALHLRAAERLARPLDRVAARINAASALLEAFEHSEALGCAQASLEELSRLQDPLLSARAEWIVRAARYRLEEALSPDEELVEAVADTGVRHMEALICLTEAAISLRCGSTDVGRRLALRAEQAWQSIRTYPEWALVARGLAIACGEASDDEEVLALAEQSVFHVAWAGIQILGLLAIARPALASRWGERARVLAAQLPESQHDRRMDVVSVREALVTTGAVGVTAPGSA